VQYLKSQYRSLGSSQVNALPDDGIDLRATLVAGLPCDLSKELPFRLPPKTYEVSSLAAPQNKVSAEWHFVGSFPISAADLYRAGGTVIAVGRGTRGNLIMKSLTTVAICFFAATLLAGVSPAAATPIVANGSFEMDSWSGYVSHPTVTGWTVVGPGDGYPYGVNNNSGAGPTPFGSQFLLAGGFGTGGGSAEQTIAGFTIGDTYELTFSLSSEAQGSGARARVSVPVGSSTASQIFTAPAATRLQGWNVWGTFHFDFVAGATSATIHFDDIGAADVASGDWGLDNVSLAAVSAGPTTVPEPATLLLLGTGLMAVARRRRNRVR
jgi:hypothetical protein